MPDAAPSYLYFKCLEVEQPIGVFYVGAMLYNQVLSISFADVRRIEMRDVERYIGIQRPLETKRVTELKSYVRTIDSSFPTSVILAVDSTDVLFDAESSIMRVRKEQDVARIIDGQHRIAGLVNYSGPSFQLNVTLFVDMDIEDQAHLFATINLKQNKVNRSLAYDLYEFASKRSPQKTSHNIAKLLDLEEGSPFYHRIKILGRATGRGMEFLTQAALVEEVIKHISRDPLIDRDLLRRDEALTRATPAEELKGLFFRNLFIDERDSDIALIVWNFFTAVATKWPTAWNTTIEGFVLNRSTGFAALSRIMSAIYIQMAAFAYVPTVEEFRHYLNRASLVDADFTKDRFVPGSGGESSLFKVLYSQLDLGLER